MSENENVFIVILNSIQCISSNATQEEKHKALQFMENFQRSNEAWNVSTQILSNTTDNNLDLQIFASQTLRNKVTYDLFQLDSIGQLHIKQMLLDLLKIHTHRLVITQLSVALARLAIQMIDWKNPILEIINHLNNFPGTLLIFFKILPEETLDIGSIPLTEDEYNSRIHELIDTISEDILKFLISCVNTLKEQNNLNTVSKTNTAVDITLESILHCLSSWAFEFPIEKFLTVEPLINLVFDSLLNGSDNNEVFEAAVDCLCIILKESRDLVNDDLIMALYGQLMNLQSNLIPQIVTCKDKDQAEDEIDPELLENFTRLFVEAGEAWIIHISKSPEVFQPMVMILLMLTCKNSDLDVVAYTFPFWFNLKQNLVLIRYKESKKYFTNIFIELIKGIIGHLQYPKDSFTSKENEDKFKEFRYTMGDVLKDCVSVVGPANALTPPLEQIKSNLNNTSRNEWQNLEAALFSLRTMAQEIPLTENKFLPQIIQIICNLPEIPKLRYSATLVLGRYTEWTCKHPELLEIQLQYIFRGFDQVKNSIIQDDRQILEIITASSHALMYFCSDCSGLLSDYINQLIDFYFNIQDILSRDIESQFELCQGLSAVINKQPIETVASTFDKLIDDNLTHLQHFIIQWKNSPSSYNKLVADRIDLLYALFEELSPRFEYPQQGYEPLVPCIERIWNTIRVIMVDQGAMTDTVIVERSMKLLRRIIERYHVFCEPILSTLADFLVQEYATTGFGSLLWCSGSVIVIFGDGESFPVSPELKEAVWQFALSQCSTFIINFQKMDKIQLNNYYEVIMDFFSMVSDLVMFYPKEFIMSTELLDNVVDVAIEAVNKLETLDAYVYILRFLDDIISWGFRTPPISTISIELVPDDWRQQIIQEIIVNRGANLVNSLFGGLVTVFKDTSHSEAINCIVKCFRLSLEANGNDSSVCASWIVNVVNDLGNVSDKERDNLLKSVTDGLNERNYRKVKESIRVFIEWFLRKNINSRVE
ncbi:hypothetical protein RI543_004484 [Arxiozyma heterogenica]|uniref:Importin N-terminal domain-containing protein n=1 Tax=Arxiozyma heterogenica TaxID=278026 RepID=A0AAN8A664_9SACH|nr:hypothetical protein RI543_004484 [Kazachstania heterogenica]